MQSLISIKILLCYRFFSVYQNTATCKVSLKFLTEKMFGKAGELSFLYMQMKYSTTQASMHLRENLAFPLPRSNFPWHGDLHCPPSSPRPLKSTAQSPQNPPTLRESLQALLKPRQVSRDKLPFKLYIISKCFYF